jgi:PAS domain S-box-containing protein
MEVDGECILQATIRDITEQRWTEKMLKASEYHYRLLAENISGVIWSVDLSGRYDYVSPTVLQFQGYSPEELLGHNIETTLPPDAVSLVRQNIDIIISESKDGQRIKPRNLELELVRKDGSKFWAEMTFAGLYGENRDLMAIQGTTRDITERKQAQKILLESERQLATIVDHLPDATFVINTDRRIVAWNQAMAEITGVPASEMLGQGDYAYSMPFYGVRKPIVIDAFFEKDNAALRTQYLAFQQREDYIAAEGFLPKLYAGKGAYVSGVAAPLHDQNGNLVGAIESFRDMTEQKRDQDALLASETKYRALYDASADAIVMQRTDRMVIAGNKAAVTMFHCKDEKELLALPQKDVHPEFQPDGKPSVTRADELMVSALENGSAVFEWRFELKDGTKYDTNVSLVTMDINGETIFIESFRDMTEQKRDQDALLASETKYRALYDASVDAILMRTPDRRIVAANPAAVAMFGCNDEAELIATLPVNLYDDYQPDGMRSDEKAIQMLEIAKERGSHRFEWKYKRRDGSHFNALISLSYLNVEGKTFLLNTIRDITEQKRAEDALVASETRYKTLYNSSADAITLRAADRRIVAGNRAAITMFGCKDEAELMAMAPSDIYPERQPNGKLSEEIAAATIETAIREGSAFLEWRYRRKDGSEFDATVAITPMEIEGQRMFLMTARDVTERKRAEEELRTSEIRYKTLYDASADAILLRTPDRRIIAANRSAVAMFRCRDEAEMIASPLADWYPDRQPDGQLSEEKAEEVIAETMREGATYLEWRYRRKDGSEFDATAAVTIMHLGEEDLLLTTIRDITAQKEAERALRASETKYKTLFDASSDAILLRTLDRRVFAANRAAVALFGCRDEEEFKSLQPEDFYAEYQPDGLLSSEKAPVMVENALKEGSYFFEWKYKRRDGTEFLATVLWTMMEIEGQRLLLTTIRDITKQREDEEALRVSERRHRLFAENVTDVIWTMDLEGYFTYLSPSAERALGSKWTPDMKIRMTDFIMPSSLPLAEREMANIIAEGQAGRRPETRTLRLETQRRDGTTLWTEVTAAGAFDEDGKMIGILGVTRDISLRKQMEDELRRAKEAAESATRAKSQFLAAMSHEIRTPMTAILGYADLLMDPRISSSERVNYSTTIRRSGEHLLALINDILDLSKIEAGRMTLDFSQCDLVALLADVTGLLRPRAQKKGVTFSVEYSGEFPKMIRTDNARLRQAIVNLIGNAVKFTEKGSIRIVASFLSDALRHQPAVRLDVIDTGIGIRPEVLPQLFQPFSQGGSSITQKYGGTGLGLAISRHLVEMLGGELNVSSVLGQGSTFSVTIPTGSLENVPMLSNPAEVMEQTSAKIWTPESIHLDGVRVLLAEDGYDNRELIQTLLSRVGATVVMAENGRIALEKAETETFDIVLMDMNMPEMDGYEATRILRERGYKGPIVALTANAMSGDSDRCLAAGCSEYLAKPIDRHLLMKAIATNVDLDVAAVRAEISKKVDAVFSTSDASGKPAEPKSLSTHGGMPIMSTSSPDIVAGQGNAIISSFVNDPEMLPIIQRFVGRLPEQIDEMRRFLANHEFSELQRFAHKLKGAGGSYGYPTLTDACKTLEETAKACDFANSTAAFEVVVVLVQAIRNGCLSNPSTRTLP